MELPREEQAFIQAVRANSSDRSLRLIYADWLEERGDPRGEYLRLEALLATLPVADERALTARLSLVEMRSKLPVSWLALVGHNPSLDLMRELTPGGVHRPDPSRSNTYWVKDHKVMYGRSPVRGADLPTFRFYLGGHFAKDSRYCYRQHGRLTGGNSAAFQALNIAYFKDDKNVWQFGGRLKDADASTFTVCDDGVSCVDGIYDPIFCWGYGFAKDKARVFYCAPGEGGRCVRKADPASFVSLGDGQFGKDERAAFCGIGALPKADAKSWTRIGGCYSRDRERVYCQNHLIPQADSESFVVVDSSFMARDSQRYYWSGKEVDRAGFEHGCSSIAATRRPMPPQRCIQCGGGGLCYCVRKGGGVAQECVRCGGSGKCQVCKGSGTP